MKQLLLLLILTVSLNGFGAFNEAENELSQNDDYFVLNSFFKSLMSVDDTLDIPCPSAFISLYNFDQFTLCFDGSIELEWFFCNVEDSFGTPYWTEDSVVWVPGDGGTYTSYGNDPLDYTYNSGLLDTARITGQAFFTGINGETCEVPILMSLVESPCDSIAAGGTLLTADSFIPFVPFFADPNLYTVTNVDQCDPTLITFYSSPIFSPGSISPGNWSYKLFIDGQIVYSNTGLPTSGISFYNQYLDDGQYTAELVFTFNWLVNDNHCDVVSSTLINVNVCPDTCLACNTFKPKPGERYWVSAWVKENHASQVMDYEDGHLTFGFTGSGQPDIDFYPSGDIIDGWQRIVGSFTIPSGTTDFEIELVNDNVSIDAFFDDIRIHPFNASMKSYVYDPETFWLTAELDDNNYATFYEYDKEGQLIRIKKETARGVMTIQESRSANPKKDN